MRVFLLPCFLFISICTTAQPGTELFKEAAAGLEKGTLTVSDVLTTKKYMSLHPETPFRELVEKHSNSGILKIATADEPGKKIQVICTVKDQNGQPLAGVLIYLYQTDSRGWYAADSPHVPGNEGDIRHARLFGYVKTDKNGKMELHTVKPSGYPQSDLPAHIHIHFSASGYKNYGTEFLFDDDDRLVGNIRKQAVQNRFIIAKPGPVPAKSPFEQQFSYSITLQKE